MLTIDWKPGTRKLREFAWICLAGFGLFGLIAWFKFHSPTVAMVFWAFAVITPVLGMISPGAVRPIYLLLTLIALPIGFVVSHVLLGAVFYLVFGAVGLFFRRTGRDALDRAIDRERKSYWTDRGEPRPSASYYRQF